MPAHRPSAPTDNPESFDGAGLCCWVLELPRAEVMWLRYVLEASEGVGFLSGGAEGVAHLIAPEDQAPAVERILADLAAEATPVRVRARPSLPQAAV